VVEGIENAYHSYENAVILLQKSFFFKPCTIMLKGTTSVDKSGAITNIISDLPSSLESKDNDKVSALLDRLYDSCIESTVLLPNQVKTYYFSLFTELYKQREKNQLITDISIKNNESIMDIMDGCFSYTTLHQLLLKKVDAFFTDLNSNVAENKIIYLIKNYIANNYGNPNLSVKDISEYAHLSVSYLCTFFKSETGTTLNQYITEYRMDKAKQMLVDPRNKISDISEQVGYNDGNYFGKSFKKLVGLSPSEYREKVMR
jgi:two-component system response regulator YesN